MSQMKPDQWLQWICDSSSTEELTKNYDQWAEKYEQDVLEVWDGVPKAAAALLAEYIDDTSKLILDVGAGTGLTGAALHALGFSQIHGMDISAQMLDKAKAKSIYNSLYCCAINALQLHGSERPHAMIATGVFADKHGNADDLLHLSRQLRDGGMMVFTVRESFLSEIRPIIDRPEWELKKSITLPIYQDPMYLLAYHISTKYGQA